MQQRDATEHLPIFRTIPEKRGVMFDSSETQGAISPCSRIGKDARIVIVGGGGTMGSSTALHLLRRGYTDVRILDKWPSPSADSAGNDLNKIAGSDGSGVWGDLSVAAWDAWRNDPVFAPHSHENGKLDMTTSPESELGLKRKYDRIVASGRGDTVEWLDSEEAILARAPHLRIADIKGWRGIYCSAGGWVAARDALNSVYLECVKHGVKSSFGPSGTFDSLLLSEDETSCRGVRCVDGSEWSADLVVFAAGAWSPGLIDLQGQCDTRAWVYAHIQLTQEEAHQMKGIPTTYNDDLGFFMEPRKESHLLKLCNEFSGYTNLTDIKPFGSATIQRISVPRSHASNPSDTIPTESIEDIKRLIKTCLPHLDGRPLINRAMCWCTDTPDARWLLCEDPRWKGLILATGDSGHTFKMLPIVGREVADLIEGKLSEEKREMWKWRPGRGDPEGTGRGGPPPKDLSEVDGWQRDSSDSAVLL